MNNSPRLDKFQQTLSVNKLINGGMDFSQRAISVNKVQGDLSFDYVLDRWYYNHNTDVGTTAVSRVASTIPNAKTPYVQRVEVFTPDPFASADNYIFLGQHIEGNFCYDLKNKTVVWKGWARTNKLGTYVFTVGTMQNQNYPTEVVFDQADVWKEISIEVPMDYFGNVDNTIGMTVFVMLGSGSDRIADTPNQWNLATNLNFQTTTSQTNLMEESGNYFELGEMMVYDKDFEDASGEFNSFSRAGRNYVEELQLCQRYFEKSYNLDVTPGTIGAYAGSIGAVAPNSSVVNGPRFEVRKRAIPSMVSYSPNSSTQNRIRRYSGSSIQESFFDNIGETGARHNNPTSSVNAGEAYDYQFTADSEL